MNSKRTNPYHHGDLKESLIASGIQILAKEGVKGLSLRAVAKLAGVSQTAPYRHFANKDALLAAIAEQGFRGLIQEVAAGIAKHRNPDRQLEAAGVHYFRFATTHPEHIKIMFGGLVDMGNDHAGLKKVSDEAFGQLVGLINDGQEAGSFRQGNPVQSALAAWSMVHGLSLLLLNQHISHEAFGASSSEQLAKFCIQLLKEGWKPDNQKGKS
jgi:AcrR family transcriptional regulator